MMKERCRYFRFNIPVLRDKSSNRYQRKVEIIALAKYNTINARLRNRLQESNDKVRDFETPLSRKRSFKPFVFHTMESMDHHGPTMVRSKLDRCTTVGLGIQQ